jgi:para-aminobenzoate synthetase/4-amino-4-deoxychorismate lyase
MTPADSRFALFDDDQGGVLLLSDYRRSLCFDVQTGQTDLASTFAEIEAAAANGEWVALAADYALAACFEPTLALPKATRPPLRAWVFAQHERLDASALADFLAQRLACLSERERTAGVAELTPALDAARYALAIAQIRRWIADGDCYQINFTFPLDGKIYGHPLALYARLRAQQPVAYGGYLATPEETLLSFSPELFFQRVGAHVVTRPMKGTAARGATPQEDEANRQALLASKKERAENIMIVDLLRNDLGRLAAPGKVCVDALCETEAYPTLWQMVSTVSAELPDARLFDLFTALFPCGSITGAPKIHAMQRIAEIERFGNSEGREPYARGLYTGAFGWLAPGGDCRFNVAIRTLELTKDKDVRLGVGSGVVIDADPAHEYAECLLKARFMTRLDPGFELIETLRLEQGVYPLLAQHMNRLAASARALGFACDTPRVQAALTAEATRCAPGVFRVRLTLAHDGRYRIVCSPMPPDDGRTWRVVLASETLNADDYLLRHKTTARAAYDRVLAALMNRPEVFDAIFLNTRGEVCEGARSNVLIESAGQLYTPPLACGLLAGVMRQQLLADGRAVERVLRLEDLQQASAIYMANALRGLLRVTLENGAPSPFLQPTRSSPTGC